LETAKDVIKLHSIIRSVKFQGEIIASIK